MNKLYNKKYKYTVRLSNMTLIYQILCNNSIFRIHINFLKTDEILANTFGPFLALNFSFDTNLHSAC